MADDAGRVIADMMEAAPDRGADADRRFGSGQKSGEHFLAARAQRFTERERGRKARGGGMNDTGEMGIVEIETVDEDTVTWNAGFPALLAAVIVWVPAQYRYISAVAVPPSNTMFW